MSRKRGRRGREMRAIRKADMKRRNMLSECRWRAEVIKADEPCRN